MLIGEIFKFINIILLLSQSIEINFFIVIGIFIIKFVQSLLGNIKLFEGFLLPKFRASTFLTAIIETMVTTIIDKLYKSFYRITFFRPLLILGPFIMKKVGS